MFNLVLREIDMEKVLQEFFWAPIPFKWYQNTSGYGTAKSFLPHHCSTALHDNTGWENLNPH